MTTTATAAADWHTLLRRAEPDRVLVCGVCNQPAHAATIYQGIRIVEFCYGTSGTTWWSATLAPGRLTTSGWSAAAWRRRTQRTSSAGARFTSGGSMRR